ncbi:ABC transporter ATP-binding protein [[Clostridium] polysaccharolyticum]|uniref:Putative ABC transport system ATP-binding protein n=1 Tax=[Clostridium] polysaccharolyticum TaxID=29364 RepID=A0A1I0ABT0_9FIRM|nr:ABC transporter ATP-binding protein [[Clostridium] polysaccharolyticum]SES91131.1 putative ABC transport system ATP-binding protein [[Clostridium] polysaccharolyticum]
MEIRLEHIKKIYAHGNRKLKVLDDVTMNIPSGNFFVIEGPSGSGKSTLLGIIAGLIPPTSGTVSYDKEQITGLDDNGKSVIRNLKTGIVMQDNTLVPYLTVYENVDLPNYIDSLKNKKSKSDNSLVIENLLDEVGLSELKNEFTENLSGGEIKRAAIARALVREPELLIMDEPTANLDRDNVEKVLKLLRRMADKGRTVIIATHESEARKYSDTVVQL